MSQLLILFLSIFLCIVWFNIIVAWLQVRESPGNPIPKTALHLWIGIFAILFMGGLASQSLNLITVVGFSVNMILVHLLTRFASLTLGLSYDPRPWMKSFLGAWILVLALYWIGAPFQIYCLPIAFAIGTLPVGKFIESIRLGKWKAFSLLEKMYLLAYLFYGIHLYDFPFLRPYESTTIFGAALMFVLFHGFSVVIPSIANENARRNYQLRLEHEVNEKTQLLLASSKMAALGEMAAGVAHEINNPLMVISNTVYLLKSKIKRDALPPDMLNSKLEVIVDTVHRIARIITGLRTFSRDAVEDPFAPVTVKALLEDTLSLCSERLKSRDIALVIHPFDESLTVKCRPVQISQVLLNLISNSSDAVEESEEKWIEISVSKSTDNSGNDTGKVSIEITDSGTGVAPEIRDRIFQPFFTTKPAGQGTGLGLSISSGIVQSHGGTIYLDTGYARTRFVVTLPAYEIAQEQVPAKQAS